MRSLFIPLRGCVCRTSLVPKNVPKIENGIKGMFTRCDCACDSLIKTNPLADPLGPIFMQFSAKILPNNKFLPQTQGSATAMVYSAIVVIAPCEHLH